MIDVLASIIDRLLALENWQSRTSRNLFTDHVEPLFLDLTVIHLDYTDVFQEAIKTIQHEEAPGESLQKLLADRRMTQLHLRHKAMAIALSIKKSKVRSSIRDFAGAVHRYFAIGTLHNQSGYTSLLDMIDIMRSQEFSEEYCTEVTEEVWRRIESGWASVTRAYAQARLDCLWEVGLLGRHR